MLPSQHSADRRKQLLARTDALLESVERLQLQGLIRVPKRLRSELADVAAAVGTERSQIPVTLMASHRYLFRLQEPLLSGRGRPLLAETAIEAERGGQGLRRAMEQPDALPALALPPPRLSESDFEWRERVRLIVQRANDRVRYLDAQARAAHLLNGPDAEALTRRRATQAASAMEKLQDLLRRARRVTGSEPSLDTEPISPRAGKLHLADVLVDLDRQEVRQGVRLVHLTPVERNCIVALAANPDRVLSREAMLRLVYGDDPRVEITSRALDVHLTNVRAKLGHPAFVVSVHGVGYRLTGGVGASKSDLRDRRQRPVRQERLEERLRWAQNDHGTASEALSTPPGQNSRRRVER